MSDPITTNSNPSMNEEQRDTIFGDENEDRTSIAEVNFDLVDAGRWLLKVIAGPNNGAEFSMHSANSYVIGTDPNSCDVVFHDTSVSRQHARIIIASDESMSIEDLKSRNQTLVDGEPVKTKKKLNPNAVITVGTTSFTVYDREGEMQTIISPLLPAIVKVLQKEEVKKSEETPSAETITPPLTKMPEVTSTSSDTHKRSEKATHAIGAFIVLGIIAGLFTIIGLGTASLFKSKPIVMEKITNAPELVAKALAPFPGITPYFNASTGTLQLMGHVLTQADKTRLTYALQGLPFINDIDDRGVIIDEYVWKEINQVLANNPNWRGTSIQTTIPGKFILIGYLQTRTQADQLAEYIAANFAYPELLERRITVEEDVVNKANHTLQTLGLKNVSIKMNNGVLTLTGGIPQNKEEQLQNTIAELGKIPGVRDIQNLTTYLAQEDAIVNISDKYEVTGISRLGKSYSVVIHGHILTIGDELDGMAIKEIRPNTIFLEKDNVKYKIDFSK